MTIVDLANMLTREVSVFAPDANAAVTRDHHMNDYRGPELPKAAVDAVLVAFVNRVLAHQGCDLGLYTCDLEKHRAEEAAKKAAKSGEMPSL